MKSVLGWLVLFSLLWIDGAFASDTDGDGIEDASDNCPTEANSDQQDSDFDGTGDICDSDSDSDGDGVFDNQDCSVNDFFGRTDTDTDGVCDYYDADKDDDGIEDKSIMPVSRVRTAGGQSTGRIYLSASVPDGEVLLDFEHASEGWRLEINTALNEWDDNGLDYEPWAEEILRWIGESPSALITAIDFRNYFVPMQKLSVTAGTSEADNCPKVYNPEQLNSDNDKFGDACDTDEDDFGLPIWLLYQATQ